ncbi:hypothetical protein NW767_000602 [Fusarium falciforme]|nr:hypothetical protein NW767_000602 [Fusarium falciforme]
MRTPSRPKEPSEGRPNHAPNHTFPFPSPESERRLLGVVLLPGKVPAVVHYSSQFQRRLLHLVLLPPTGDQVSLPA